jgi:hypothetical protein
LESISITCANYISVHLSNYIHKQITSLALAGNESRIPFSNHVRNPHYFFPLGRRIFVLDS